MIYPSLFERELTKQRPTGGRILAIDARQREDGLWQMDIQVSWRPNQTFTVCKYATRQLKLYAKVATLLRHIVREYEYTDKISVYPRPGMYGKYLI
jgi:hypothetical protein